MMRRKRIRLRTGAGLLVLAVVLSGCGDWQGLNSLAPAGGRGPWPRRVHDPGADAGRRQHRTELAGPGGGRHGRQRDQDRAPGLARTGHDGAQQQRRPSRQRHCQARSDQPVGFTAHRTGAASRRAAGGQTARRFADPAGVGKQVPQYRTDVGRGRDVAQWRWDRPCSGHHRGVQHRLGRPRSRPAQPDRAARRFHRVRERPKRRHHRREREPEQPGRPVRRAEAGGGQGITDHPRCAGGAERRSETTSPRRLHSWASSARWPPIRSTRPRKPWLPSSKTLGRCWNHWPMRVRRSPAR